MGIHINLGLLMLGVIVLNAETLKETTTVDDLVGKICPPHLDLKTVIPAQCSPDKSSQLKTVNELCVLIVDYTIQMCKGHLIQNVSNKTIMWNDSLCPLELQPMQLPSNRTATLVQELGVAISCVNLCKVSVDLCPKLRYYSSILKKKSETDRLHKASPEKVTLKPVLAVSQAPIAHTSEKVKPPPDETRHPDAAPIQETNPSQTVNSNGADNHGEPEENPEESHLPAENKSGTISGAQPNAAAGQSSTAAKEKVAESNVSVPKVSEPGDDDEAAEGGVEDIEMEPPVNIGDEPSIDGKIII